MTQALAHPIEAGETKGHAGYRVTIEPSQKRVRVDFNGKTVADSDQVLVMHETGYTPIYYFPRAHVRTEFLRPSERRTHCPFKGDASYWSVVVDDEVAENAVWSYEAPYEESAIVKDYLAFYWDRMGAWYEDDQPVDEQGASPSATVNPFLDWLVRKAWQAPTSTDLVHAFAHRLLAAGLPLWRLRLLIRTLHPQLFATNFAWQQDSDEVKVFHPRHTLLESSAYLDSPYAVILRGEGGVRRRLDGPDPLLDYPILAELHAEGATDYVAMPMRFSDGQINIISMTSRAPGGFSVTDLGRIYEILPLLSRLFEVYAGQTTASTLLGTYLGRRTGERVLNGLVKRGDGEDIHAAIWFCDLRNSTALSEGMARADYLATLNDFFDCMIGPIVDHGGEVLKYIGDAVLAIFPIDGQERSAKEACARALAAADAARARIAALNQERTERGLPDLGYGIGLHRGNLTYGNIGSAARLDFTVIGAAVNEAARIEDLCKTLDHPVLISATFAESVATPLVSLGRHELRGVSSSQEVFAQA